VRISFKRLALREMHRAAKYYETRRTGLGLDFLGEGQGVIDIVRQNPYPGHVVEDVAMVRQFGLARFPYNLFLDCADPRKIVILAVAHHSRRPFYWRSRISHGE
jgi:toxin ParE1/3/4